MFRIYRFDGIDSTNAEAIRRAKEGEPEGAIFTADSQTAGRGRLGRGWESPPGKNLYVSFLFRPPFSPPDVVPITRMAAEAVVEALNPHPPRRAAGDPLPQGGEGNKEARLAIKWPNDILLGGKKVAGILCEMGSEGERTAWVVCGIGINVNSDLEDFSPEIRKTATSLKIVFGRELNREEVLSKLVDCMERYYERFKRETPRD